MKEAAIYQSPHAINPERLITEEERRERYRTRIDSSTKPYTVLDVLRKVYHRDFVEDLKGVIGNHPEQFKTSSNEWSVSRIWVNEVNIIRSESVFFQPVENFRVDILVEARVKLEEVQAGNNFIKNRYNIKPQLRLRYRFDLRPCHMSCYFGGAVLDEKFSLLEMEKGKNIPVDKYLLPVLIDDDYPDMADHIMRNFMRRFYNTGTQVDLYDWVKAAGLKVMYGIFPENGVMGEYFFDFGMADIIDPVNGMVSATEIDPGTIILNFDIYNDLPKKRSTLAHEMTHHFLGRFFLLLQKMHGKDYCSYMCKRYDGGNRDKWTAMDIMEMHANKMPGYLLIQEKPGREQAGRIMSYYNEVRNLDTMRSMVNDMADHFGTTKTVAKTRLVDFGYTEAKGLMQTANGDLVAPYLSKLEADETYTIDEADGIREYIRNPEFRDLIRTGRYLYVDGHYCLNERSYVFTDQFGRKHLTSHARENMDKCCIVFRTVYQNNLHLLYGGLLQKGVGKGRKAVVYRKKDGSSPVTEEGKSTLAMIRKRRADRMVIEKNFNQMTVDLMERHHVSRKQLAELTGLSEETIKNMRNDPERMFPIQSVVAVVIALHLDPVVSKEYIRHAPSGYLDTDEMACYEYAQNEWYDLTVPEVNRKLVEMDVPPLTNLVAGFDENGLMIEEKKAI